MLKGKVEVEYDFFIILVIVKCVLILGNKSVLLIKGNIIGKIC